MISQAICKAHNLNLKKTRIILLMKRCKHSVRLLRLERKEKATSQKAVSLISVKVEKSPNLTSHNQEVNSHTSKGLCSHLLGISARLLLKFKCTQPRLQYFFDTGHFDNTKEYALTLMYQCE